MKMPLACCTCYRILCKNYANQSMYCWFSYWKGIRPTMCRGSTTTIL